GCRRGYGTTRPWNAPLAWCVFSGRRSPGPGPSDPVQEPTVHDEVLPGDEGRGGTGQEGDGPREFLGSSQTAVGDTFPDGFVEFGFVLPATRPAPSRELDRSGGDGVDPYPLRCPLTGERGGVVVECGLDRTVGASTCRAGDVQSRGGGDQHHRTAPFGVHQVRSRGPGQVHEGHDVGVETTLPLVGGGCTTTGDIGDQHVQPTQGPGGLVD